ncbi:hypothetical protein N9D69_00135 [Flavobacteriales bacterium]|nr:hypothetical protein [Flavobacteriales bacterium]
MKKTIFFSMLLAIGASAYANPSVVINENNNSNTIADINSKMFVLNETELSECFFYF